MRSTLLALAVALALLTPPPWMGLARTIAGETPTCGMAAKLAVAHVYHNRLEAGIAGGWAGDSDPTAADLAIALVWDKVPDPTGGALYAIGYGDRERIEAVGYGDWLARLQVTAHFGCGGPYFVETLK